MRTVLAVDDDRDIVRLITDGFRYEPFEVIPAYTSVVSRHKTGIRTESPPGTLIGRPF